MSLTVILYSRAVECYYWRCG